VSELIMLGVIGCGEHGRYHAAIGEEFEVTAVFDPLPSSIAAMREILGKDVPSCETEEQLAKRDDVEAVLIASTDKDHAKQALIVAREGKHLLCEKPIATSVDNFILMEEALTLAENNFVMASCHPRRSNIVDLAYGWIYANLPTFVERFGRLERVWLNSIYPRPRQAWKEDRSLLQDKYVHDADLLLRLSPDAPLKVRRMIDSFDHYGVEGTLGEVGFQCGGTRLHGADDDYVEIVHLGFTRGDGRNQNTCTVYVKTGVVRFYDSREDKRWEERITPMNSEGYDRVFTELMSGFANSIRGGQPVHSFDELRIINGSAVALAGPSGTYRSA
jgi:predicted dehydrogenase